MQVRGAYMIQKWRERRSNYSRNSRIPSMRARLYVRYTILTKTWYYNVWFHDNPCTLLFARIETGRRYSSFSIKPTHNWSSNVLALEFGWLSIRYVMPSRDTKLPQTPIATLNIAMSIYMNLTLCRGRMIASWIIVIREERCSKYKNSRGMWAIKFCPFWISARHPP